MPGQINIADIIANEYEFVPLETTWYEKDVEAQTTQTLRFAKRKDHTGVLIQINKEAFFDANP